MNETSVRHSTKRKPRKCPVCGASPLASIYYGLPNMDEALEDRIKRRLVVLGGCCVTEDDPSWQCNDCGVYIYQSEDD